MTRSMTSRWQTSQNEDAETETLKHNRLIHLVSESTLDGVTERASRDTAPTSAPAAAEGRWPVTKATAGGLNDAARSAVYDNAEWRQT